MSDVRARPAAALRPRLLPLGDAALTVEFAAEHSPEAAARARRFGEMAMARLGGAGGLRECVPALRSVTLHLDPALLSLPRLIAELATWPEPPAAAEAPGARWCFPVCYGGAHGPDLAAVAQRLGLSEAEVVARHAEATYSAACIGGFPGFAYLSGLDASLALPRRDSPRTVVAEGSVGIALRLTAIYPAPVPGGWHLLGRTPVPLFAPARAARPAVIRAGDAVRFRPVDAAAFQALWHDLREGRADPLAACRDG